MKLRGEVESGQRGDLSLRKDGTVVMGQRLCMPDVGDVRREIMEEAIPPLMLCIREVQRCIIP